MKYRLVALGVLFLFIGAFLLLTPGLASQFGSEVGFLSPSLGYDHSYLIRVNPGNYSYIKSSLGPYDALTATVLASPQGIDFFLMNSGNFSAWTSRGNEPSQVYPQSSLDVNNYTFTFSGGGSYQSYFLIFLSRSSTTPTNVLLHLVVKSTIVASLAPIAVPLPFVAIGAVLVLYGARKGKSKKNEKAGKNEAHQEGGSSGPASGMSVRGGVANAKQCRFCGAGLEGDSSFCPSCKMSQG